MELGVSLEKMFMIKTPKRIDTEFLNEKIIRNLLYIGSIFENHKIIHGDIKPSNYIMFGGALVKISDFGLSEITMQQKRKGLASSSEIFEENYLRN